MILLIAIVQSEDVAKLSRRLVEQDFHLTQINATGGFLSAGNAVLLLGVEEDRLPVVHATIEATCQTRTHFINATPWPGAVGLPPITTVAPVEVLVGGAVVFSLPVRHFLRLRGGPGPLAIELKDDAKGTTATAAREGMSAMAPDNHPTATPESAPPVSAAGAATQLVVAIVQNEDANPVVDALVAAGHRLTRLNSAGGFLRRGNATLLIGVEAQQLEDVLAVIHANCKLRTEPNSPSAGMPMYGATVFVLEASHFMRF